jgi:hypothetical protein
VRWLRKLRRSLFGPGARALEAQRERLAVRDMERLERQAQRLERQAAARAFSDLRDKARMRYASAPHALQAGPDFICMGMQKAGTIWLYDQVGNHPDIWQPPIKELHALTSNPTQRTIAAILRRHGKDSDRLNEQRVERGRRGIADADMAFVRTLATMTEKPPRLDVYAELFAPKGERLSGDITPGYSSLNPDTIKAVADAFPEVRIVFLAREPVDRAWSYVSMNVRREELGYKAGVRYDDWTSLQEMFDERKTAIRSYPSAIVRRWRPHFGDRFGVFFFDDLRDDAQELRRRIGAFIGVDPDRFAGLPAEHNRKSARKKVEMSEEIRERLVAHFAGEIRRCADELGGRALEWPARHGL